MPAPQFHLSFGQLVPTLPGMPEAVARVGETEATYIRLGSIFHDLPYYGNMIVEAIRYGLGSPALDEPWAYRMHSVRPGHFVASFIRAARTVEGLTESERLALVVGLLSHCALDLTLHPLVNYCARRDQTLYGGHESMHHRITEKYHALFFHLDRLGFDPIGGNSIRQWTRITKQVPLVFARVEPALVAFMRDAYQGAYGNAPAGVTWAGWVRSFQHFGALVGNPLAARNSKKVRTNEDFYRRYFENDSFNFWDFYRVSEERAVELITLGHDYFMAGDFSPAAEAAFVAAARIDDLAEPEPRGIPELPRLTVRCTPGVSAPAGLPPWRVGERKRLERQRRRNEAGQPPIWKRAFNARPHA